MNAAEAREIIKQFEGRAGLLNRQIRQLGHAEGVVETIEGEEFLEVKIKCVNEHANASRIIEWMNDPKRKPALHAFTEGPERQIAYIFERYLEGRKSTVEGEEVKGLIEALEFISLEHKPGMACIRDSEKAKKALSKFYEAIFYESIKPKDKPEIKYEIGHHQVEEMGM